MNHPIYKDKLFPHALQYEERGKLLEFKDFIISEIKREIGGQNGVEETAMAELGRLRSMFEIRKNGHALIDASVSDWESKTSEKTLSFLKMRDFAFPFSAGAVRFENSLVYFYVNREDERIFTVNTRNKEGMIIWHTVDLDISIGEQITETDSEFSSLLYSVISILLYISSFHEDRQRVISKPSIVCKGSKKKSIPAHKINIVSIKQYEGSRMKGEGTASSRNPSTKCWITRGHWRNQYYSKTDEHKPKWIEPFWKGSGSEEVSKVYKV